MRGPRSQGALPKGAAGEIANFTGIDSPYEPAEAPDLVIDGRGGAPEAAVEELVRELRARGLIVW